jgi:hypothetical protein
VALLVGLVYVVIGRVFAVPSDNVKLWRLAAWVLSAVAYGTQIWYEHFRLRNPARSTALHAAIAVAIGAFGLAVAGMIRSMSMPTGFKPRWFLALVAWPPLTAIPAFLVALALALLLARFRPNRNTA